MSIDFARASGAGLRLVRSAIFGSSLVVAGLAPALSAAEAQAPVELATAASYAVLADGAVTNNGNSVINGDLGVHPGTDVSGFPPGVVNGQRHVGDPAAQRAQSDLTAAYNQATGRASTRTIGPHLEGQTLTPGVYKASESANLAGTLTLDARGNSGAVFIFQLSSRLTTAQNSKVRVVNSPSPACSVFWAVGDSATLGSNTSFVGRIMAVNGVTLESAAKIEQGGALSRDGAVRLDDNVVSRSDCAPARPPTAPASPTSPTPSPTVTPTPTATTTSPAAPTPTASPAAPTPTAPTTSPAALTPTATAPGTTAPAPTTPGAAVPETVSPTAAPETAVPAPSVPELTVPPSAAPAVPGIQTS